MSSSGITLNVNIASYRAQRQLSKSSNELQRTFERLSSGLRITRASDDASGLSVASLLNVNKRVYQQGIRNLNDGISYLNISDGATEQLKNILIRCRELATQAANGTATDAQRSSIHQESVALSAEFNRILTTTEFNGRKVFEAQDSNVSLQCGYGTDDSLEVLTGEGVLTTETIRVSTTSTGAEATGASSFGSISADGRFVVFHSSASDLVAGDTNGQTDVFVKDILTGTTTRVSTDSSGNEALGGASLQAFISADGRYVAFGSDATNLVVGDTNGQSDIFLKDLATGRTTRVSTNASGTEGTGSGGSDAPTISADGRYVAFRSNFSNLVSNDTNSQSDVFVKDTLTGAIVRASTDSNGAQTSSGLSTEAEISANGRYVIFRSSATNLVSGDTNAQDDIFMKDLLTGVTTRVNTDSTGAQATGGTTVGATLTPDGRYVAFSSTATNLVSGDTNGLTDVFVKDTLTGTTVRATTSSSGQQSTGGVSGRASLSSDGRFVTLQALATNLVDNDVNGVQDIFVKDLVTGSMTRVSLSPSGAEVTGGASSEPIMSADGRFITFYSSATNLVSGDTNAVSDIFVVQNIAMSSTVGFRSVIRPLTSIYLQNGALARAAQGTLDDYLDELNVASGHIGSSSSRISAALSVLDTRVENLATAESRILDIDVAMESSSLTRNQILQQASSAILAQANLQPQIALALLNG